MVRSIAIGDIHGGLKALKQVMQRAKISKHDQLIFMGDYVDGWSESAQVIDHVIALPNKCIFLKGNHDFWCEGWLQNGRADKTWLEHGGRAAMESYKGYSEATISRHLDFFADAQLYYIDDANRLFIHAGFTAMGGPLEEPDPLAFVIDRNFWKNALALRGEARSTPPPYDLFSEIFIGHTPTTHFSETKPMQAFNVYNIDTGAAFTGKLTAMDVDTKKYWQSDPLQTMYPNEKGRNQ